MSAARSPAQVAAIAVATVAGVGYAPVVPGTAGTLAAVPLVLLASRFLTEPGFAAVTAALIVLGVWSADVAAGPLGAKDPKPVVIDEVAGYFVTLLFLPRGAAMLAAGFVLFRIMDILKPPPARGLERWPGGWGIVADDVVAGLYANCALRLAAALWARMTA